MDVDTRRAKAAGLVTRPLAVTVHETATWLAQRDNAGAWAHVLDGERERAIVTAATADRAPRPA